MSNLPALSSASHIREATTANSADIPENDHLWRTLTQAKRDLAEIPHAKQREIAIWLWRHNGFAKRYSEIIADFTAGDDPHPQSEDEQLQEVLDAFWDDPVNRLREFGPELSSQLGVIGEQFVTVHVRKTDGRVRVGYLDPDLVEAVVPMPGNPRDLVEVILKAAPGERAKIYRIVRHGDDLDEIMPGLGRGSIDLAPRPPELRGQRDNLGRFTSASYDGLVFSWRVNALTNSTRGTSDLFAEADYLDALDKAVFNAAERSFILNTLAFDLACEGVQDEVELKKHEKSAKRALSTPGGTFTHNEKVTLSIHSADLKSADMAELVSIVKLTVLGSWGFPLHWFADGGEANLATAGEMGGPTIRKLQRRQTTLRGMLRTLCDFQIAMKLALASEELSGVEDPEAYDIILPEIASKDTSRETAALTQMTGSISQAVVEEWLTRKSAGMLWQQLAGQITGFEFREEDRDLLDRIDEEQMAEPEVLPGDDGMDPEPDPMDPGEPPVEDQSIDPRRNGAQQRQPAEVRR